MLFEYLQFLSSFAFVRQGMSKIEISLKVRLLLVITAISIELCFDLSLKSRNCVFIVFLDQYSVFYDIVFLNIFSRFYRSIEFCKDILCLLLLELRNTLETKRMITVEANLEHDLRKIIVKFLNHMKDFKSKFNAL